MTTKYSYVHKYTQNINNAITTDTNIGHANSIANESNQAEICSNPTHPFFALCCKQHLMIQYDPRVMIQIVQSLVALIQIAKSLVVLIHIARPLVVLIQILWSLIVLKCIARSLLVLIQIAILLVVLIQIAILLVVLIQIARSLVVLIQIDYKILFQPISAVSMCLCMYVCVLPIGNAYSYCSPSFMKLVHFLCLIRTVLYIDIY